MVYSPSVKVLIPVVARSESSSHTYIHTYIRTSAEITSTANINVADNSPLVTLQGYIAELETVISLPNNELSAFVVARETGSSRSSLGCRPDGSSSSVVFSNAPSGNEHNFMILVRLQLLPAATLTSLDSKLKLSRQECPPSN